MRLRAIYSIKVYEHFMCPQNAHSMPDADAKGSVGDPSCGDALTVFIKVENNRIADISYQHYYEQKNEENKIDFENVKIKGDYDANTT